MQQRLDQAIKQFLAHGQAKPLQGEQTMSLTQTQIDQAIRDQLGINPFADLPSNPVISQALENTAANAIQIAASLNRNLVADYLTAFGNWSALVLAGKILNTDPPKPPAVYLAVAATDGWSYVIRGTDPVCQMPSIPSLPQPSATMVVAIGTHIKDNFWTALRANNAVPNGFITPEPVTTADKVTAKFMWVESPWGGWWEKLG
jgi:hypothetical protein